MKMALCEVQYLISNGYFLKVTSRKCFNNLTLNVYKSGIIKKIWILSVLRLLHFLLLYQKMKNIIFERKESTNIHNMQEYVNEILNWKCLNKSQLLV